MIIDHTPGLAETEKRCRHRWRFAFWVYGLPKDSQDARHQVERCARCDVARLTMWIDGKATYAGGYADSVRDAVLGRLLNKNELERVRAGVGVN